MIRHQDDTGLRSDLAAATLRVGEITDQIGSKEEALKAFQTALSIYESLAGADRSHSSRSYRAGQGRCLVRMAMIEAIQGKDALSLSTFKRALGLLGQLHREQPGDPETRADLALANHYLALRLGYQGSPKNRSATCKWP